MRFFDAQTLALSCLVIELGIHRIFELSCIQHLHLKVSVEPDEAPLFDVAKFLHTAAAHIYL